MLYQTHAQVHLDNIKSNIDGIRAKVGKNRKILIAVKSSAYGHGAVEVSKMAENIGVDWLGVATVPEAVELREAGIVLPILKFSPAFEDEMKVAIDHNITIAACELENTIKLNEIASDCGKIVDVHLKIDTGMGRIGVAINDAADLAYEIEHNCKNIRLGGVMTHLPSSDDASYSFTQTQLQKFKNTLADIETRIGRKVDLAHCANSGAVLSHPDSWLDMVRPGIMIYGYYPSGETAESIELKPGLSFKTRVSFIKKITKGTSVGYGRTWIAPKDCYVATFPAGYADGFNRLFSNMGRVLIDGESYPVVGRVCMDQSMCNLGATTNVKVGDELVLIGESGDKEISAYEWEEKLKTITYEVTCQINHRVKRYFDDY